MDIDDIYLALSNLVAPVTGINWVDQDWGQLDDPNVRPAVQFPCVLIAIDLPRTEDIGQNKQNCNARINLRIGFTYAGEAAHSSPEVVKARALAYYAQVKNVYKAVQGQRIGATRPLKRVSQMENIRPDKVKLVDMTFEMTFIDSSAASVSP